MQTVEIIDQFEQLKSLADPRRLAILRILMDKPASLTQIGKVLGQHPARVRHHMQKLEQAGLVEISEILISNGAIEKIYRAHAGAFILQALVLPQDSRRQTILFSGSHDLALEHLSERMSKTINLLNLPVGSLEGLVALRQGFCQVAGSHLLDSSGEYNVPFVRHFFPEHNARLVTLAYREQGLLLAAGNPKGIHGLVDLLRPEVTFINRQSGSGTRLWLDGRLKELGIPSEQIRGYGQTVRTHTAVADRLLSGLADAGIGLRAAAIKADLYFIPLFTERFDLTFLQEHSRTLEPLLDQIQSVTFRREVSGMSGYDTTHTGEQIIL